MTEALRPLLTKNGRFPTRRTWERRLGALPDKLPGLIGCLGRHLVALLQPWAHIAARLTAANEADSMVVPALIEELPFDARYVLGDTHHNTPEIRLYCAQSDRYLVATRRGAYPHTDPGAKARQVFHQLRSQAIEPFNGLFKNFFEWHSQVPVKGLRRTQLFLLGAVLLYQLVLLYQFERQLPLGRDIKPLLRAA